MPLESLRDARPNIRRVSAESPEHEPQPDFDPKKDISRETRQAIVKLYNELKEKKDVPTEITRLKILLGLKLIDPKIYEQVKINSLEWVELINRLGADFESETWDTFLYLARDMKLVAPDLYKGIDIDKQLATAKAGKMGYVQSDMTVGFARDAYTNLILNPENYEPGGEILKNEVSRLIKRQNKPSNWSEAIVALSFLKVAEGENFPQKLLTPSVWKSMKEELDQYLGTTDRESLEKATELSRALTILGADKAIFTEEDGLQLKFPEKKEPSANSIPPQPHKKKY